MLQALETTGEVEQGPRAPPAAQQPWEGRDAPRSLSREDFPQSPIRSKQHVRFYGVRAEGLLVFNYWAPDWNFRAQARCRSGLMVISLLVLGCCTSPHSLGALLAPQLSLPFTFTDSFSCILAFFTPSRRFWGKISEKQLWNGTECRDGRAAWQSSAPKNRQESEIISAAPQITKPQPRLKAGR